MLYFDGDVEKIVRDHFGGLRGSPTLSTPTRLRIRSGFCCTVRADVWVDKFKVVQPREKIVEQAFDHGWASRLETVANFWNEIRNQHQLVQ